MQSYDDAYRLDTDGNPLLPCPFCKEPDKLEVGQVPQVGGGHRGAIACERCNTRLIGHRGETQQQLNKRWNDR